MENMELNMNEMENVTGGRGGSRTPLAPTKDYDVYRIESGTTMIRIAHRFHTTVDYLMAINPTITNKNDITAGYYMYIPKQH